VLLLYSLLKFIFGRSPKVKEFIEDPIQVGDLVEKRSCWVMCQCARYDRCIGYVSVTAYVLALSSNSGFPGFGSPGMVFLLIEFPLC
jgi:hypothetical protein